MKKVLSFIGTILKVALVIFMYLMAKGLILLLLDGWAMIIAYILLISTMIVILGKKVKKNLKKESK